MTGCASKQIPFQKMSDGIGYSVEEKSPANFLIKTSLPVDHVKESTHRYAARAVGEECFQRGFEHFDFTVPVNGVAEGFCFKI